MADPHLKRRVRQVVAPMGIFLSRLGISPNAVTGFGLLLAAACGIFAGRGCWGWAFGCFIASSLCDLLDGAVARARGGAGSPLGAALDSTVDRYGEALILSGVLVDAILRQSPGSGFVWLWCLALTGSFLTSYVRARAEGLGLRCEVGLMERPERLVLIGFLLLIGPRAGTWILGILALGGHITFLQRLLHIRREAGSGRDGGR